jgi:hypothetical protein
MTRPSTFVSSLTLAVLLGGCAADPETLEEMYSDEALGEGKADGVAYGSAPLRGVISNLDTSPNAGVEICAERLNLHLQPLGLPLTCTTTDATGRYVLNLRPFARYELHLSKAGQVPVATLFNTGLRATDFFATMVDANVVPILFQLAGSTYDPTKGFLSANAYIRDVEDGQEPPPGPESTHVLPGMAFELVGTDIAPIYMNDQGLPDATLTATSNAGLAIFGNVDPGDYDAAIAGKPADIACAREHQPRGITPGTVRTRVREGSHGGLWFRCIDTEP